MKITQYVISLLQSHAFLAVTISLVYAALWLGIFVILSIFF